MLKNIEASKGLPMAESLMTKLIENGLGRGEAHELMSKLSLKAIEKNKSLKDVFSEENKKLKIMSQAEVNKALDPKSYLGATPQIIERAVKKLERR